MLNRNKLSILIYHRVHQEPDPINPREVDAQRFDWQMDLLAKHFNVIPLSTAVSLLPENRLPARSVCITFDDGYADNFGVALPILKKHGLHATFFVSTGFLDGGRMWNDTVIEFVRQLPDGVVDLTDTGLERYSLQTADQRHHCFQSILKHIKHLPQSERQEIVDSLQSKSSKALPVNLMMTRDQVRGLADAGMEIGAHTVSHPILAKLDAERARQEIVSGKKELEQMINREVRLFAYPNGKPGTDYLPEHVEMVKSAGFSGAVATTPGISNNATDVFQLRRFTPWDRSRAKFLMRLCANAIDLGI